PLRRIRWSSGSCADVGRLMWPSSQLRATCDVRAAGAAQCPNELRGRSGIVTAGTISTGGRSIGELGAVTPSRQQFRELAAAHRVIPVARRLLADDETPVGLYRKLAADRAGTFLLESAENGRSWSRWSFVGAHCAATLTEHKGVATWLGAPPAGMASG